MAEKHISPQQEIEVRRLIDNGVFQEINGEELRMRCAEGFIINFCGDCDQSLEFQLHLLSIMLNIPMDEPHSIRELVTLIGHKNIRMHQLAFNGGPLRMNKEVAVPKGLRMDQQLLEELITSRQLKKIPTFIQTLHGPCGLAHMTNCSLSDTVWHNITTARFIQNKLDWDHNRIIILAHIAFSNKKRTFFVKKKAKDLVYG